MTNAPITIVDLWTIFHDGTIDNVTGDVPGDLKITVSIEYLRERIPHPGDTFTVVLEACSLFAFRNYESESVVTELSAISELGLGLSSAKFFGSICRVFCEQGTVDIKCQDFRVFLDSDNEITLKQLGEVSSSYWDNFGTNSN